MPTTQDMLVLPAHPCPWLEKRKFLNPENAKFLKFSKLVFMNFPVTTKGQRIYIHSVKEDGFANKPIEAKLNVHVWPVRTDFNKTLRNPLKSKIRLF